MVSGFSIGESNKAPCLIRCWCFCSRSPVTLPTIQPATNWNLQTPIYFDFLTIDLQDLWNKTTQHRSRLSTVLSLPLVKLYPITEELAIILPGKNRGDNRYPYSWGIGCALHLPAIEHYLLFEGALTTQKGMPRRTWRQTFLIWTTCIALDLTCLWWDILQKSKLVRLLWMFPGFQKPSATY